jgi:hypothetical protein
MLAQTPLVVDAISIRERPAEIEDRTIPGHWEGDLLGGTNHSHIATLVERHSRFAMLIGVPSKDTAVVVTALSQHVHKLPATLRRSLTWDRGLEMAQHKTFTVATNVKVTSVIRRALGSAAPTKKRTGCCDNTFVKDQTCQGIFKQSSTRSRCV